jgi:hypothetical protein
MIARWVRLQRSVALWTTGVSFGIFATALQEVDFASVFTQILSTWLAAIVSLLLGGDASAFIQASQFQSLGLTT